MAVEAGKPSTGSVKTDLRENAVGLPGILMQGIATIGPSFAILASFVFIVSFAGLVTPWAYLFGGILLGLQALSAAQLAKVFPSAGGWYTWIAPAFHPRAGLFARVLFFVWPAPARGVLRGGVFLDLAAAGGHADHGVPGQDGARAVDQGGVRGGRPVVDLGRGRRGPGDLLRLPGDLHLGESADHHRAHRDRDHGGAGVHRARVAGSRRVQLRAAQPR